jgi:hypothetical protein
MINAYRILAKIDLPKDVRREAGKLNIYVGKVLRS